MDKRSPNPVKDSHPDNNVMRRQKNRFSLISSFFTLSEKLASSRCLKWILLTLLPVMILLKYPVDRLDYDLWWQMALGKYYLTHHTLVIDHSIFSWTPADSGWIYNTFLGSIIFYLIYSLAGGLGLWVFQWFIFIGIFLSFYVFLRIFKQRLDVTSITLIAAIGITFSVSCNYYKPELFSPLILSWMAVAFYYIRKTRRTKLFYIYPFVFALWVNLHGAFILGFCFLASISIGELLNRIFFPRESFADNELIHLWTASFLSFLATFLNPYGINYLLNICNAMLSETYAVTSKNIQAYVSFWPYLKDLTNIDPISFFKMGQIALIMVLMLFSLLGLFIYDLLKNKSCDFSSLVLTVATFLGSMEAVRAVYMFPLVFFLSFFYLLQRLKLTNISARATILSLLVFLLLFFNLSYFTFRYGADNKWFGAGLESFAPEQEVAFLKKYRLEGPIFNDYLIGGYLMWALYPDYKVFIDPRLAPYSREVAPDYWKLVSKPATPEDIRLFTKKYPFKTAIIHYRELPLIFDFLKAGWRLVYFEKNAVVLVDESVVPRIPREVQFVDLGPMRFKDVKNPEVLLNVFSIYVNLNPQASSVIYDIYQRNVSNCYKLKAEHLRVMREDMRQKNILQNPAD